MTPDRDEQIERLCHEALALDEADRAAFLARACDGDEALLLEVSSLLPHDEAAERFLDVPALSLIAQREAGREGGTGTRGGSSAADTLAPGARFGLYEVLSVIGIGGMGEVYRARDTRLHRDVALKVLPDRFSRDTERLARFEREAHVLASLSHPNIATIHGIEHVDGISALVLEVVEGQTLADRLRRGPLPVDEALEIAHQIAEALEAAHERGIVHRDLKPANVMVTLENRVKLLDFGVAKVFDDAAAAAAPSSTSNGAIGDTRPGLVPGTAAYMSPEQARGEVIDRRSDIWAFGCVLFEMLTGRSPFQGRTVAESMANVLDGHLAFEALPNTTPVATRRLLRLCLERSPRQRLQHIGDARVDIADTRSRHGAESSSPRRSAAPSSRRTVLLVTIGAAVLAAAVVLGWFVGSRSDSQAASPVVRFSVMPTGAPLPAAARSIAISPDGSRLAYVAGGRLWLRELAAAEGVQMPGTEGSGGEPFFSPDGEWVGFFDLNTGLRKLRVRGGTPLTIVVNAGRQLGGSWGTDGTIVFADGVGLFTIDADGGPAQPLARPAAERGEVRYAWPHILPGRRVALFSILRDTIANAEIALIDLDTKQQKVLLRGGHAARYVATGHVVYAAGGQLHAVSLDLNSLAVSGQPFALRSVRVAETFGSATANFDVSQTGTLVYVAPTRQLLRTMVWVDRMGREQPVGAPADYYFYPRISPDGTRVALDVGGANRDIWVWNLEREVMTRITDGPTEDMMPAWSVDGKRILFASDPEGVFNVFARSADGSGPSTRIYRGPDNYMPFFSPDAGRLLVFVQGPTARSGDVAVLTLQEPVRIEPLIRTEHREGNAHVSPDGRWVAYQSDESGRTEIYIRSFPSVDQRKEIVSRDGGTQPRWGSAGSGELFYRTLDGTMRVVAVKLTPDLTVGATRDLFSSRSYAGALGASRMYDVSPRDSRFLMLKEQASSDASPINVVVNWFDELTHLAPTP
jgi:eukaryotic-like serine/threonine-protein kinase